MPDRLVPLLTVGTAIPDLKPRILPMEYVTAVIEAATRPVHLLSTGSQPEWKPGGRP